MHMIKKRQMRVAAGDGPHCGRVLLLGRLIPPQTGATALSRPPKQNLRHNPAALLLDKLLERCRALGLLTARGPQRTDSTHVLAAIRVLNRLELVVKLCGPR